MPVNLRVVALLALVAGLPVAAHAQGLLDRTIGSGEFSTPIIAAQVDDQLIGALARAAGVPMGIELATEPEPKRAGTPLTGLTVSAALDAIIAIDPRYEWRDMNGTIVLRTREAWASGWHPLHDQVPPVLLGDIRGRNALSYVAAWLGGPQCRDIQFGDSTRFTLQFDGGTVLDLLNAVVRAHGELAWSFAPRPTSPSFPYMVTLFIGSSGTGCGVPGLRPAEPVDPALFLEPLRLDGAAAPPVLERIVGSGPHDRPLVLYGPVPSSVGALAAAARVPMGIEFLGPPPRPSISRITATGRRVRDVLDAMIAVDPRYEWREMHGVIVIRPAAAWYDPESLLFRPVPPIEMIDVLTGEAIARLGRELGREDAAAFPETRRISLDLPPGTILDFANAIVRAHGELTWTLAPTEPDGVLSYPYVLTFGIVGGGGGGVGVR
jgi:hypothetical protein